MEIVSAEVRLPPPYASGYAVFDEGFAYLFNSYYEAAGPRHTRSERGLLSRPLVAEVTAYRAHVDQAMAALLEEESRVEVAELVELGLQHEKQHQELLLMDAKHLLAQHPMFPSYRSRTHLLTLEAPDLGADHQRVSLLTPDSKWLISRTVTPGSMLSSGSLTRTETLGCRSPDFGTSECAAPSRGQGQCANQSIRSSLTSSGCS